MGAKTALIRLATALIPSKKLRRRARRKLLDAARDARIASLAPEIRSRYAAHAARCREKLARGEKIKVAFLICDASMFSGESVYLKMKDDPRFDCSILIAPRTSRGGKFLRETQEKTLALLSKRYGGAVRAIYSPDSGREEPIVADVVFDTILYEDQSLESCTVENLSRRSLVAVIYYGYGGLFKSNEKKTPHLPNVSLAWRFFVSNRETAEMFRKANPLLDGTVEAEGYCKMDRLADEMRRAAPRKRKRVIIAPHHTIDRAADGALALSTFLANAGALLELPAMFPEVDFVFRPHPLLFPRLSSPSKWGESKAAGYLEAMAAFPNVEIETGGDYFATFASSDALLHDCGSFLAEYFYTGRPQCFMLESDATVESQFLPFARELLGRARRAYGKDGIVAFVRDVAAGAPDPQAGERAAFARERVCVNYPDASGKVVESVLRAIAAPPESE